MIKRVYIEITNVCNLSCSFCKTSRRAKRTMSTEEFTHILQEIQPTCSYIYLHVQGEPLLHPSFDSILDQADQYGFHVQLVTNGTLLVRYPNLLKHPSIRKIAVSLQSMAFQDPTKRNEYEDSIRHLIQQIEKQDSVSLELRFWRSDQSEISYIQDFREQLLQTYSSTPCRNPNTVKLTNRVYLSYENDFEWPEQSTTETIEQGSCHGAVDQIAILSDGSVVPCCLDCEGAITFGNIFQQSFSSILKSDRYQKMVQSLQQHRLIEPLCISCTYRKRFDSI